MSDNKKSEEGKSEIVNNQDNSNKKKQHKEIKLATAIISIVVLIVVILLFSTIFALVNMGNTNIIDGVLVKEIELVGLSKEDAKLELEDAVKTELSKNITLHYEDYEVSINPEQIEASYDIDSAIEEAYSIGRNGNIIKNNYDILFTMFFKKHISPEFHYNDDILTQMINDISRKMPGSVKDNSYYIEGDKLIITKGTAGNTIKVDEIKKQIIEQIKSPSNEFIEIPVQTTTPPELQIETIYQEVHKEPKDAYFTQNPFTVFPHEDGVDFAISIEEARQLLTENKEEYEIPLKFIKPNVTTNQIGTEAFPNLLSSFSTRYDAGNVNRSTNLALAASKINGTVLLPGEEFSYNKVVGERTIAAGYKQAHVFSGGQVVDGLGGGICQISSTLYNAVVQANLEVTKRTNHQFLAIYVEAGKDATVVYGAIDFRFKNNRKYPIKIEGYANSGVAEMKIYGVKEEVEYDVKLETETLSTTPFSTQYIEDSSLAAGVERVQQYGTNGVKCRTYKVCRLNGAIVSKTLVSQDTYSPLPKIIRRGTKGATPVKTTSPEQTKAEIETQSTTVTSTPPAKENTSTTPTSTPAKEETKTNTTSSSKASEKTVTTNTVSTTKSNNTTN